MPGGQHGAFACLVLLLLSSSAVASPIWLNLSPPPSSSAPSPYSVSTNSTGLSPASLNAAQGCTGTSLYGYGCARNMQLSGSWQLSYTVSISPVPPDNDCTRGGLLAAAKKTLPAGANAWIHFMVSSATKGWLALTFADSAGSMSGTAVQGGVGSTGGVYVAAYILTGEFLPDPENGEPIWAQNMGASVTSDSGTAICWSRPAYIPNLSSMSGRRLHQSNGETLDVTKDLAMSVASSSSDDNSRQHSFTAGYTLNMASGAAVASEKNKKAMVQLHGGLMLASFIFMMPTAVLFARHKKLVPNVMLSGKAIWFWIHMGLQLMAALCFGIGLIVAWSALGDNGVPTAPRARSFHGAWGIIVLIAVIIQILIGFIRPDPDHKKRWIWNILHHNWGRLSIIKAWVNISTGVYLYDQMYGTPNNRPGIYIGWVIAVCVIVGLQLLAEVVLQIIKHTSPPDTAVGKAMASAPAAARHSPSGSTIALIGRPGGGSSSSIAPMTVSTNPLSTPEYGAQYTYGAQYNTFGYGAHHTHGADHNACGYGAHHSHGAQYHAAGYDAQHSHYSASGCGAQASHGAH